MKTTGQILQFLAGDCHNDGIANPRQVLCDRWCQQTRHFSFRFVCMPAQALFAVDNNGSRNSSHGKIAWISFEALAAYRLLENLQTQFRRLNKKHSKKRVHDTRVALRRWCAVWNQLRQNGWESPQFNRKAIKPLQRLLDELGKTRDLDVLHDLGKELGCSKKFLRELINQRNHAEEKMRSELKKIKFDEIVDYMRIYVHERKLKLEQALGDSASAAESVADHINAALAQQEHLVKSLERDFDDPKGMHRFRLAIKGWRYLLTEMCSTKSDELEKAQTLLGEIHDLDTLKGLLMADGKNILALANLKKRRAKLLEQAYVVKRTLPYGLRAVEPAVN